MMSMVALAFATQPLFLDSGLSHDDRTRRSEIVVGSLVRSQLSSIKECGSDENLTVVLTGIPAWLVLASLSTRV
jgi:hypothetical protein